MYRAMALSVWTPNAFVDYGETFSHCSMGRDKSRPQPTQLAADVVGATGWSPRIVTRTLAKYLLLMASSHFLSGDRKCSQVIFANFSF